MESHTEAGCNSGKNVQKLRIKAEDNVGYKRFVTSPTISVHNSLESTTVAIDDMSWVYI